VRGSGAELVVVKPGVDGGQRRCRRSTDGSQSPFSGRVGRGPGMVVGALKESWNDSGEGVPERRWWRQRGPGMAAAVVKGSWR
jgi:hypothetical protein